MTTNEMSDFLNSLWCWARCTEEEQRKLSEIADYLSSRGNVPSELEKNSKKLEKNFGELDCIDRQAALDAIIKRLGIKDETYLLEAEKVIYQQILAMPSVTPQEPQSFKWCTDCKEYDQEKHCCHRYSKVIRNTVEEMKQEPKTGHWIEDAEQHHVEKTYHCSECGHGVWGEYEKTEYCGGCGAKMVEPQESEVEDGKID